jgi:hypothetical protein
MVGEVMSLHEQLKVVFDLLDNYWHEADFVKMAEQTMCARIDKPDEPNIHRYRICVRICCYLHFVYIDGYLDGVTFETM